MTQAETDKEICYKENFYGVRSLAAVCKLHGMKLITFSSDLVFDGQKNAPYVENDLPVPINIYGRSKQLAENFLASEFPDALIIRTAAFFGPWDHHNFAFELVRRLQNNDRFFAANDLLISPTYLPHLVNACLDLLIDVVHPASWHLTNKDCLSWYEFAKKIAERTDLDTRLLIPVMQTGKHLQNGLFIFRAGQHQIQFNAHIGESTGGLRCIYKIRK